MKINFDSYKCWEVDENKFPKNVNIEEQIKFILKYAILAPSTFNSQPWKCKINKNKLEVYLDRDRITQKSDKTERFAHISMGAFIENLIVAADHFGLKTNIEFIKHSKKTRLQHLANISFEFGNKNKNELFDAIKKRSTNRSPSKNKDIDKNILKKISSLSDKKIKVIILDEKNREKIASISKLGDFNIWTDIEFRKEHVGWVRTNLTRKYDGMPGFGVNANMFLSFLATPVILSPIFPKFQSKKNIKAIKSTKYFIVVNSKENFQDWIEVGILFEKLALMLANFKMSVSPMGQFIEDNEAREELRKLIKPEKDYNPQLFFRIGYSTLHVPHSPRFPVDKILF